MSRRCSACATPWPAPADRAVPMALNGVVGQRHPQPLGCRDVLRLWRGATASRDVQLRRRSPAAMSHSLAARSIDHVVLERGQVANSWRTQRWDSLRLLTPNWMTRLPGFAYRGPDPDGYLGAGQVAALLADYAAASAAPVLTGVTVTSVRAAGGGYVVRTDRGSWRAQAVVLACGAATLPAVPALAR